MLNKELNSKETNTTSREGVLDHKKRILFFVKQKFKVTQSSLYLPDDEIETWTRQSHFLVRWLQVLNSAVNYGSSKTKDSKLINFNYS